MPLAFQGRIWDCDKEGSGMYNCTHGAFFLSLFQVARSLTIYFDATIKVYK